VRVVGEVGGLVANTVDDGTLVRSCAVDADHLGARLDERRRQPGSQEAARAGHDDRASGEVTHGSPRSTESEDILA
jgi:hypothetical protein